MKTKLIKLQNKFIWILIKAMFNPKTQFKTILRPKSKKELEDFRYRALLEENYELAALLEYYINFKFIKNENTVN